MYCGWQWIRLLLTLLHSERPKLYTILAFLSAIGLTLTLIATHKTCLLPDSVVSAIGAEASSFPDNSNLDDVDGATAHLPEATPSDQKIFQLCLIHGGMDTVGEVFDDVMIVNLETT